MNQGEFAASSREATCWLLNRFIKPSMTALGLRSSQKAGIVVTSNKIKKYFIGHRPSKMKP